MPSNKQVSKDTRKRLRRRAQQLAKRREMEQAPTPTEVAPAGGRPAGAGDGEDHQPRSSEVDGRAYSEVAGPSGTQRPSSSEGSDQVSKPESQY